MLVKSRLYLDKRAPNRDGLCHLKIAVQKKNDCAFLPTGVYLLPTQWVNNTVVTRKDSDFLNRIISAKKFNVDRIILEFGTAGLFHQKSAKEIVNLIQMEIDPEYAELVKAKQKRDLLESNGIVSCFTRFIDNKSNPGTKGLYIGTLKKIREFCDESQTDAASILIDDIRRGWLESFENFCLKTEKQNTASIHLRNIRAVINMAIDEGLTSNYPFRKFKIKKEETADKSYSAKELRTLFNHQCYPGGEQEAVDMFKLMFCLIGINSIDLANLTTQVKGRIEYRRAKTQKYYSIKVEPEAAEIIEKYHGEKYLVDILERCPNYKTYFNRLAKTLRKVGKERVDGKKSIGKAILPDVCTGSARTSWATIAQEELDIPRDIIAAALGHHTVDVTSTYLRTDWKKKVDEANRKVLDWVFYEKK